MLRFGFFLFKPQFITTAGSNLLPRTLIIPQNNRVFRIWDSIFNQPPNKSKQHKYKNSKSKPNFLGLKIQRVDSVFFNFGILFLTVFLGKLFPKPKNCNSTPWLLQTIYKNFKTKTYVQGWKIGNFLEKEIQAPLFFS